MKIHADRSLLWTGRAAALGVMLATGCGAPPPPPAEVPAVTVPPAVSAPEPIASAVPSAAPSAVPSAAPSPVVSAAPPVASAAPAAPAVDRLHCQPHSPAVSFEVKDDDVVIPLDADGCPLGESHFKSNGYSYKASTDFMTELQKRVAAGDRNGLAELANYPLRVNLKKPLIIKDRAAFLKEFDRIYTAAVAAEIAKADPRDLFCRDQGVMLGRGIVWADNDNAKKHYGVIAINPP